MRQTQEDRDDAKYYSLPLALRCIIRTIIVLVHLSNVFLNRYSMGATFAIYEDEEDYFDYFEPEEKEDYKH